LSLFNLKSNYFFFFFFFTVPIYRAGSGRVGLGFSCKRGAGRVRVSQKPPRTRPGCIPKPGRRCARAPLPRGAQEGSTRSTWLVRPYQHKRTGSHQNSEVRRVGGRAVLGWVPSGEVLVFPPPPFSTRVRRPFSSSGADAGQHRRRGEAARRFRAPVRAYARFAGRTR